LDKGKTIVLEEWHAPMVERSSKTKKIRPSLSTKRKTQIREKKRKKQRSGRDVGETAGSVPEVIFELHQNQVGEIANSVLEIIFEVPKDKFGELEKTPELRVKSKTKFRVNEGSDIAQSSSIKTRSTQEEQVPTPTSNSSGRKTRNTQEEQVPIPPSESSRRKMRKAQEKQSLVPISEPKTKKRRLFEDEISIPVSTPEEVSGLVRRTTWSMAKKVTIPHVPYFLEDPVDIPTSPEKEDMYVTTISEVEELVTETLKDLRREEITEQVALDPVISLTKHQLVLKFERLTKQNE
jgi:hypothetical protein